MAMTKLGHTWQRAAVLLSSLAFAGRMGAQDAGVMRHPDALQTAISELRIVRITPSDSGTPGSIIAVTFDRAVGDSANGKLEARRVMTVSPKVAGTYEWYDATTVRFVPNHVIRPGSSLKVSLDTAAIASGAKRTGRRYEFRVTFRGARPLALVVEEKMPTADWALGPSPIFRVLYSTAIDVDSVAAYSRLVFPTACGGSIPLKVRTARPVVKGESRIIENAGGFNRDTTSDRFRSVVELQPADSLRPNCLGVWQVASFDSMRPRDGWRYGVRTAPAFAVSAVHPCVFTNPHNTGTVCEPDGFSVVFSAQVSHADFVRAVHVLPDVPLAPPRDGATTIFTIPAPLTPHQEYTVTIDSTLRDTYGRKLNGPTSFTVVAHDPHIDWLDHLGVVKQSPIQ